MGALLLAATIAIELLAALILAFTFLRRTADREYGVAALFSAAAAVHASGALIGRTWHHGTWAATGERLCWLGLIAAMSLGLHFAITYGPRGDRRQPWLAAMYAAAAILAGVTWAGTLGPGVVAGAHVRYAEPEFRDIATRGAATIASGATLALLARCYLDGRREALALVVGSTLLTAASINDLAVAGGSLSAAWFVDGGLLAFVLGVTATISARYTSVAAELDRRTTELRTRTHELRRSYEDLRTAQEELVKKEQLAVVGELAAVIAHEVRNPLAIIANAVAGLRKQAISREDHETLLAILDEETSRLNRLVTDLLRYARPVNVQRSQFVLADLLERALAFAKTKKRSIRMELLRDAPGREGVWGDANLLRQVFDNLIDNAVQAMGSGGTLTIRMRSDTQEGIGGVAVDIIDTGEGMDTQVRSRARDPFFTTRPSGTGLGLAIVDRIVDAHGGQFAIDSRAGEGTTVTVFLPSGSASEPPQARGRSSRPDPRTSPTPRRAAT
ncbi:MAG: two-component system sensor histidine kinase NtrB [Polyangiaceae bacterium]